MHIGEATNLLLKKSKKTVCVRENMYDVICSIHQDLQHAGYKKTFEELKHQYSYIPRKLIVAFINACSICTNRWPMLTPMSSKPNIANEYMLQVQVDLIDLRTQLDGDYKYIAHTRDHFTHFSWAIPLKIRKPYT